ncbi:MAG TPA: DegT/DnrJ/EryC1/StrS family aminotransferase [Gammaproteobacteria bacterium]
MTTIPLVDLHVQHRDVADEIEAGFAEVVGRSQFVLGPRVAEFEAAFARYAGVRHCVGVGNGTDAIELMLRSLSIGEGDEVIVPANTFIATALAVVRAGASPVLVDVDPQHYLIDVDQVKARIGPKTRAIIAVHLYGQTAPVERLAEIAADSGIPVLEDAAQAHGATRWRRRAGGLGVAAAFSFYPSKNLGAYGDAGAVATDDDRLAAAVRRLRNWGSDLKYRHAEIGFNSRLDSIQAVVLRAKLKHLDAWNDARRVAALRYDALLSVLPRVALPRTLEGNEHVWHLYVVQLPDRDRVQAALQAQGIDAGIHYPVPIHRQGAFRHLGLPRGAFPVTERLASACLSLPLFPGITPQQQERVANALALALG